MKMETMKSILSLAVASLFALGGMGAAHAQEAEEGQADVQVRANVIASCSILTAPSINFGVYDATGANRTEPKDAQVALTFVCNAGSQEGRPLLISIDGGENQDGNSCLNRRMSSDLGDMLAYEIHSSADRTTPWGCVGDNPFSVSTVSQPDDGQIRTVSMFGRIPAGQAAPRAGAYSDSINLSLSF